MKSEDEERYAYINVIKAIILTTARTAQNSRQEKAVTQCSYAFNLAIFKRRNNIGINNNNKKPIKCFEKDFPHTFCCSLSY